MKTIAALLIAAGAGVLGSCSTTEPLTPVSLFDARQAYAHASASTLHSPEEMLRAREALVLAEQAYRENPQSDRTRDLARVAEQLAKAAETTGGDAPTAGGASGGQDMAKHPGTEQPAGRTGEKQTPGEQGKPAKLPAISEQARGLVITLPASDLFSVDDATLSADAQMKLNQVFEALVAAKHRKLTIEGYTNQQGSAAGDMELSRQRAIAVRAHLITRGYPREMIQVRGLVPEQGSEATARRENPAIVSRVEIVVDRPVTP